MTYLQRIPSYWRRPPCAPPRSGFAFVPDAQASFHRLAAAQADDRGDHRAALGARRSHVEHLLRQLPTDAGGAAVHAGLATAEADVLDALIAQLTVEVERARQGARS